MSMSISMLPLSLHLLREKKRLIVDGGRGLALRAPFFMPFMAPTPSLWDSELPNWEGSEGGIRLICPDRPIPKRIEEAGFFNLCLNLTRPLPSCPASAGSFSSLLNAARPLHYPSNPPLHLLPSAPSSVLSLFLHWILYVDRSQVSDGGHIWSRAAWQLVHSIRSEWVPSITTLHAGSKSDGQIV